jgi:hypothetical protein
MTMKTILAAIMLVVCASTWIAEAAPVVIEESFVEVRGSFVKPGKIFWTPDLTALGACLQCGGFVGRLPKQGHIIRGEERIAVPLKTIALGKAPDVKLLPGDVLDLTVPTFNF